jgi:guanylate kinase
MSKRRRSNSMNKRVIIVGKGGSGKDHLRKSLSEMGYKYCVSHTSRPPRQGEEDGVDYFFVGIEDVSDPVFLEKNFYEWVTFNGWFYGTSVSEFKQSDLLIMTPSGVEKLRPEDRKDSHIIYLDIPEEIRRQRLLSRRDADHVERILTADQEDFSNFDDYDEQITDPFFNLQNLSFLKN